MSKLTETMHELSGIPTATADLLIKALGEAVEALLVEQGECNIPGLGKIKLVERAAREGRNPATGEHITIPAKMGVKFMPAKALKDTVIE